MKASKLCLIDANSLFYRAYYAIKAELATSRGEPTNAVFGFVKMVRRLLEELTPDYLAVCFDVGRVTHRTKKFRDYKIHRPSMPEALLVQLPAIKDVVRAYRFPSFEAGGFEADDVIATLAEKMRDQVGRIIIVSSDKDILQLVGANIDVYNPYKEKGVVFTPEMVREKFGVPPERIPDLISLMGDVSDNIPGARGIGEKTAVELLAEFGDVASLARGVADIRRAAVRKIVEENLEMIRLSHELAVLSCDVPLEAAIEDLKIQPPDRDALWELFTKLEFKGMLKELSEERLSAVVRPALDVERKKVEAATLLRLAGEKTAFAFFVEDANAPLFNFAFADTEVYEVGAMDILRGLFETPSATAVGYDVKSAFHILRRLGIETRCVFFDVFIAASLVDSARPDRDLEALLWDYLSLKGLNRLDYLGKESHFLLKLREVLEERLAERGLVRLFWDVEMPLIEVLFEMEEAGIALDIEVFRELSRQADKKLEKLTEKIYDLADCRFNINSPKQLSDILFTKLKLPVVKRTKTGLSTDEEVLTKLSRRHELPRLLLEYRSSAKLKTTYLDALPDLVNPQTGRIHGIFDQAVAQTGRLSSRNPNLQNIPIRTEMGRRIRGGFVASRGYDGILSADYSQIELRVLAHLSQDAALLAAFAQDADVHRTTASLIFGAGESDVTDEMRETAKRINFGIIYGMSAYGLSKDVGIDVAAAQTFIDEYFARYPRVKEYLDAQIEFVKTNGYVTTILGRRRYIPEIHNANTALRSFAERQAVNAPIQGSAADLIKAAMIAIHRRLKKERFRSRLILQVHDELVFEFVEQEKESLAKLVKESMEGVLPLSVPLKVVLRSGKNWLEVK